jgi:hypothetical protein
MEKGEQRLICEKNTGMPKFYTTVETTATVFFRIKKITRV